MKNKIATLCAVLALCFAVGNLSFAQTIHISHCLAGCPVGASASNDLVVRNLYAISINGQSRVADWAAYRVIPGAVGVASLLPRQWLADPLLDNGLLPQDMGGESEQARQTAETINQESSYRTIDVTGNAEDRGRLVPMSSFAGTPYWSDLNLLTNMAALTSDMRLGSWSRLDQAINSMSTAMDEVFVITGPIYQIEGQLSVSASAVNNLPGAFYKLVANRDGQVSVFVFAESLPPHARYCDQRSELNEVERLTGLEFFPQQPQWPLGSLDQQLGCSGSN